MIGDRVPDAREYRFRLPRGFARLRSNFGEIIRKKRLNYAIKQEVLALDARISLVKDRKWRGMAAA